jgi:two-component system response regulator YesN
MATDTKEVSNAVVKVLQFIEKNVNLDLNRDEIAEQVYLNPAYLSRLFRKETGKSLTDYMSELRVEKAKRQLENSNIKISDIAVSVGYSNFSHFSQLFKKLTGMSPQEYRKKYQDLL